jgi:hypothetical protein
MKKTKFILAASCFLFSLNAFANSYNCNKYLGKTGYVDVVAVGVDNSTSNYISFTMEIDNAQTDFISVKATLDDNSGVGMYNLLLEALNTQTRFTIQRCYDDELAGGYIKAN